ncbi:MAG: sulfatase, partial [Armatimonadota bacterium]
DVGKMRAAYYGKITLIDRWFGRIFQAFERRGWWENTLVIFWSDHGEMAGDHGYLHKSAFYSGALNAPFILRWPGRIPAGETSDALVEIMDAFPTLLEAIGLPTSERALGKSLWPLLRGEADFVRDAAFSEVNQISMLMTGRYKYAVDSEGDGFMLFDVSADPDERENLVGHPDFGDVEEQMRERLLKWLLATQVRQR